MFIYLLVIKRQITQFDSPLPRISQSGQEFLKQLAIDFKQQLYSRREIMELGHSVIHGVLELGKLYAISFPHYSFIHYRVMQVWFKNQIPLRD